MEPPFKGRAVDDSGPLEENTSSVAGMRQENSHTMEVFRSHSDLLIITLHRCTSSPGHDAQARPSRKNADEP
jgi:hypothetical protein